MSVAVNTGKERTDSCTLQILENSVVRTSAHEVWTFILTYQTPEPFDKQMLLTFANSNVDESSQDNASFEKA